MLPKDSKRGQAIAAFLTKVDANLRKQTPSKLDSAPVQLKWLDQEVIKNRRIPLTYTPQNSMKSVNYTAVVLREHINHYVKKNRSAPESSGPEKKQSQRADDIFVKGSEILTFEFLRGIGYVKKKPQANKSKGSKVKTEDNDTHASTPLDQANAQASQGPQDSTSAATELQGLITDQDKKNGKRKLRKEPDNDEATQQPVAKKTKTGSGYGGEQCEPQASQGLEFVALSPTLPYAAPGSEASDQGTGTDNGMPGADAPPLGSTQENTAGALPSRVETLPATEISSSIDHPQNASAQPSSPPVKRKNVKIKGPRQPIRREINFPSESEELHPRTVEPSQEEAQLAQAPQISGTHHSKSVDSREEPRMIALDEYNKVKTELNQWKAQYQKLQDQYDEVSSSNRELGAHMEICKSTSRSAEANRKVITMNKNPKDEPSWTEQETDPQKRLQEYGLPPLRPDSSSLDDKTFEWPHPHGEIHDISQHLVACHQDLNTWMKSVHNNITNVAAHYMKHINASDGGLLRVVDRPGPGLEQIYKTFFGSENGKPWTVEARSLLKSSMTNDDFLAGLIGAAVHETVFRTEYPWSTADEWFDILKPVAQYWNEAMKAHGTEINLGDVVWHGLHKQIMSRRFQIRVVMPEAFKLAKRLAMVLEPQLELAGISSGSATQSSGLFQQTESSRLTEVFMAALTVKGLLKVMPIDYSLKWSTAGTPFDDDDMELQSGCSTYDVGAKPFVSRAITPVLKYRSKAGNSPSEWMRVLARGILLKTEG